MHENRAGGTRRDVTARFRGYQRADKMHMLVRTRRTHTGVNRGREGWLTLHLCGTSRDVISDDGINYWKAPDGQLFAVLISLETVSTTVRVLCQMRCQTQLDAIGAYNITPVHLSSRVPHCSPFIARAYIRCPARD